MMSKDDEGPKTESGLKSPTSINMQNTFICKNADESFDAYYMSMKKRKTTVNMDTTGGYSATLGGKSNFGVVSGVMPAARDGHSAEISE